MVSSYKKRVAAAVSFLVERITDKPRIAIILGTGLGDLVEKIDAPRIIPYEKIPNFPQATVTGHAGNLVCGRLAGEKVAVLQGRFHYYEGYSTKELTLPVRTLALLGAEILIITNAAGGLNASFRPGAIMVIRDHLNFIGENPLRGLNVDEWGPRFPDMSAPYDGALIDMTRQCAVHLRIPDVVGGVYVAVPGPSLETPAETRYLRQCGADAVGMSSTPEVIVGKHAGMRILGLSVIANVNDPDHFIPVDVDDVIAESRNAAPRLLHLLMEILKKL